jgi:hypothetical protein
MGRFGAFLGRVVSAYGADRIKIPEDVVVSHYAE